MTVSSSSSEEKDHDDSIHVETHEDKQFVSTSWATSDLFYLVTVVIVSSPAVSHGLRSAGLNYPSSRPKLPPAVTQRQSDARARATQRLLSRITKVNSLCLRPV